MVAIDRDRQAQKSTNRGSNQIAVRSYNERLILHLVRHHGNLTKSEAARATGLSANAVSVIFRALEEEDLVIREAPLRGRIGQPSTPVRLNPDARHYFGLKIGRRSADLVLIDFVGGVLSSTSLAYRYPTPADILAFVKTGMRQIQKETRITKKRVFGFGIAMPFEIWSWADETGFPKDVMEEWRNVDLSALLSRVVPWPMMIANDATAACVAEQTFAEQKSADEGEAKPGDAQDAIYLLSLIHI